jgi:putative ABC transport system permease protein
MFRNYFKTAYRNLLKNKVHSAINLAGLSIGIACAIIISIFVGYESGFDGSHRQSANTYRVVQHTQFPEQVIYWGTTCYPLAEALRNDFGDFAHVAQASGPFTRFFSVDRGSDKVLFEERNVLFVDTAYTRVFDLEWLAGNPKEALMLKNSVVLTENTAEKSFGKIEDSDYASILGKVIMLNGKDPLNVTGVVKDPPGNINLRYNMLVPYAFFKENNPYQANNWSGNYRGTTFVVLRNNEAESDIEAKVAGWKKKYLKPEDDARISYMLQPLSGVHNETLYENVPGGYAMPTKVLNSASLVALIILIIAAVNFVNLTTAKAITRSKEVGIRKVMGSSRSKLILQFVYEHSLLIVLTLAISVGISQLALDQLNNFLTSINLKLTFSWDDAGMVLMAGFVVILAAAIYPAIILSSFKPVDAVKNKITLSRPGTFSFRRVLIVFQFAAVQMLIIATIVVALQINHFNSVDLGFVSDSVVTVAVPTEESRDAFRNRLMENQSVAEVTFGSNAPIPVDAGYGTSIRLPQQPETEGKEALMIVTDLNYLSFFEIELIAGRNISAIRYPFDEFVVNEEVVKSMGWTPEQALGQKLMINEGEATIVGVVKDFHNQSLKSNILPAVMMNWAAIMDRAYIRLDNPTPNTMGEIETAWKEFAPHKVFSHAMVSDAIEKQYGLETLVFSGFTVFSILAIIIGCLGLFGLSSFMAVRRAKEIGIRKVLGASLSHILSKFSQEFVIMVIVGFVFAVPVAWMMMNNWLQGFAYRIDLEWWMFVGGGALALLIAIVTVSFHSIRASMTNPVESLRSQ